MNKEALISHVKTIDSEHELYGISCPDCVTYRKGDDWEYTEVGGFEGRRDLTFKTVEEANTIAQKHIIDNPLHNPKVSTNPIIEYLIHTDKYMIRYRTVNTLKRKTKFGPFEISDTNSIHVHSVNGYRISGDKCAFGCKQCGAIFQSKGLSGHTMFPVEGEKCEDCLLLHHKNDGDIRGLRGMEKICVCEDLDQLMEMEHEASMWERDLKSFRRLKEANRMLQVYKEAGIGREDANRYIKCMSDLKYNIKRLRKYLREAHYSRGHKLYPPTRKFEEAFNKVGLSTKKQYNLFFTLDECDYWYWKKGYEETKGILKGTGYEPRTAKWVKHDGYSTLVYEEKK